MTGDEREEVNRLLAENRRLRELLSEHGIASQPRDVTPTKDLSPRLGTDEKVKLLPAPISCVPTRVPAREPEPGSPASMRLPARSL